MNRFKKNKWTYMYRANIFTWMKHIQVKLTLIIKFIISETKKIERIFYWPKEFIFYRLAEWNPIEIILCRYRECVYKTDWLTDRQTDRSTRRQLDGQAHCQRFAISYLSFIFIYFLMINLFLLFSFYCYN